MNQTFEPAILEFEAALHADPEFTLAALRRADLLVSQMRQTEGFAQWRSAMQLLSKRPVTRAEELYARGMFSLDTGAFEAADRFFRTWSVEYPHDWRAPFYRMIPLVLNGHAAQALELLQQLQQKMPEYGDLYAQMIACHLVLGQTREARNLVPELAKRGRPERADMRLAYTLFREADFPACLDVLRSIQKSSYQRGAIDATMYESLLFIDAGLPEAAAATADRFLRSGSWAEIAAQQVALKIVQAWAEMLSGRKKTAVALAREVLDAENGPILLALAGTIFARCGEMNLSQRALQRCEDFQDFRNYGIAKHRILGSQAAAAGQAALAEKEFRAAAAIEPKIAHRQYLIEALPPSNPERLELALNVVRIPWQHFRPPPLYLVGSLSIAVPIAHAAGVAEPFIQRFRDSAQRLERLI